MKHSFDHYWARIGLVCLSYVLALGLLFSQQASQEFVFIILVLPLAVTAFAFGPLVGVGFGLMTGTTFSVMMLLNPNWSVMGFTQPLLNILIYLAIGAGFGLLHINRKKSGDEDEEKHDAWEHALDIQLKLDPKGQVIESNLRARNVLGSATHFFDFVHPEEKDTAKEQLEYAFARDESRWTLRVVDINQLSIPVEAQLIRDNEQLMLELHDLSELYKIERRLSEAEARYRVVIEDAIASLDTGILVMDRNQEVIYANDALGHILGVNQERLVGRDLNRMLDEAKPNFLSPDITEKIAETAEASQMTIGIQNGKGPRIFDFNSIPISTERYQGGRIDYYHDITEIKKLEKDLRQKTTRLEAANERLEAFTHVVSHDLKEPLRSLEMFSGYIIEDYEHLLDEEGKDYLSSIGRAAKRMKGLIEDLLELASIGRLNEPKEQVNINQVLDDVMHDLEASLEGVKVNLPPTSLPDVVVNRTRIEQLFANLISNGVKYNDKTEKQIDISWEPTTKEFRFCVRDNGIGIEKEYVGSRIFELFERLNPHQDNYESTGAGLAICKRIVEEYGGKIWAESKFGEGSAFYFTLPKPKTKVVNQHETAKNLAG